MVSEATTRRRENGAGREINQYTYQGLAGLRESTGASEESWPYLVSAFAGVVGVGIASLVGAAELAVGVAAAYVAYDVIARGVPLWDAIREAEKKVKVE
jgi:hypothetical protein